MPKLTTAERWRQATTDAANAISILIEIQEEFQHKLDETPEGKLGDSKPLIWQEICDLNLNDAADIVSDASNTEIS